MQEHKHYFQIEEGLTGFWYCEDEECEYHKNKTKDPWSVGEESGHKHEWYGTDLDEHAECYTCGMLVECDHNCDLLEDTEDHNHLTSRGVETRTQKIMVCSRCNTVDQTYDPNDEGL